MLQDIAAQVLVLDDIGELLVDVGRVDLHIFLFQIRGFEGKLVENLFKNGVQAARADVFRLLVDAGGEARDGRHGIIGKYEFNAFGIQQRDGLFQKRVLRLREDADEVLFLKRLQFDADGQTALQFGNEVGRFADVKCACRHEKNVVR